MTSYGPALSTFVLVGWITVPVIFPQAIWALIGITLIYLFTKFTETIVVEKGQLPSLYQCYYKAFYCFKKRKLTEEDSIPYISSQCADVIMNTRTMYDFDGMISSCFVNRTADEPITSEFLQLRDTQAEALRLSQHPIVESTESTPATATVPADEKTEQYTIESSNFVENMLMRRKVVPISEETFESVRKMNLLTDSTYKDMSFAFYHVPSFKMDFSGLTFGYFPLSVWNAKLERVDMTILRPINRKTPLYINSRVTNPIRTADGTVEVACINDISVRLFDFLDAEQCRIQCIGKSDFSTTIIASLTHYYTFQDVNVASKLENVEEKTTFLDSIESVINLTDSLSATSELKSLDITVSPKKVSQFANLSGNLHPRHLEPKWSKIFGEEGNFIDGMLGSSLAIGALERLAPTESLTNPLRIVLNIGVDASLYAPVDLISKVSPPVELATASVSSQQTTIPSYPHILERQLRHARAKKNVEEKVTESIDPALLVPSVAEKLLPVDWKKAVAVELTAVDNDLKVSYVQGVMYYDCTPLPSLDAMNMDIKEDETQEPVPLMSIIQTKTQSTTEDEVNDEETNDEETNGEETNDDEVN